MFIGGKWCIIKVSKNKDKQMTSFHKEIKMPKTDKQGLQNALQLVINDIETGNNRESVLRLVDLIDSLNVSKFSWIDPDFTPDYESEPAEEPIQRGFENTREVTIKEIYHRNYYYI